jgi:hypothetical protein
MTVDSGSSWRREEQITDDSEIFMVLQIFSFDCNVYNHQKFHCLKPAKNGQSAV